MLLTPGIRLGPYEIIAPLGAGGMGEVYRALDTRLRREIAVKVLPAELASQPDLAARFEREARAVAALNHPNIVVLHSIEHEDGIRFLTMELVEGRTLDQLMTPGGLPIARVLEWGIALADALVAAHARGVVHRDLKPANVMLTREGRVKVLDFGLARLMAGEPGPDPKQAPTMAMPLSDVGQVMGTVPYMSPEQVRGGDVDARSDLFALGIILYELATGRRPFLGATFADVSSAILRDTPPPVPSLRAGVPADVSRIIVRCLDKDPERRVQTAKDVRNELELVRQGLEPSTVPAASRSEPDAGSGRDMASIAVLPFENRSHDAEDEYFADGITEDVIAQLCKVRTLKVISRNSVMAFKGHRENLRDIAARLGVAHVLEGSVRRVTDRVRIVAQLVDPNSGQNLWAETYDRQLKDIFEIQTDVALQITSALRAELTTNERDRIRREHTPDLQAYELYLHGRQCLVRFNVENLWRSITYFDRALERDAVYAPAHVGLAMAYTELAEHGVLGRAEAGVRALSSAARAVALDPDLGDAHCALAFARVVFDKDWAPAEAGYKRALELSPGNVFAHDLYGRMCAGLERFDEAIALHQRAHELDPLMVRADLATTLLRAGRTEEARRFAARAVELEPHEARLRATHGWALFRLGRVGEGIQELELAAGLAPNEDIWLAQLGEIYGLAGEAEKARAVLRRLQDPSRPAPPSPYHLAYVHTGLGDAERAMDCLELAYRSGAGPVYGIKGSFLLAPLRTHPRFVALLEQMRLG